MTTYTRTFGPGATAAGYTATTAGANASSRLARRIAGATVVLSLVVVGAIAAFAPMGDVILRFVPDDAFYYLEVARRAGLGEGSTFDGINTTNGYHPLWLAVLLPIASLMDVSRGAGVRVAMGLGVVFMGAAYYFLWRTAARRAPREAFLAPLFAAATLSLASNYGVESPLAAFLLALLLYKLSDDAGRERLGQASAIGLIAGLLVLSRLDSAVYVLAMDLLWAVRLWTRALRQRERVRWTPLAASLLAQASLVIPYLVANRVLFGSFWTVSALVKGGRQEWLSMAWTHGFMAFVGVAALGLGTLASAVRGTGDGRVALHTAAGGTGLLMLLILLKGGQETYHWYYALPALCVGLFVSVLAAEWRGIGRGSKAVTSAAVACALLLLAVSVGRRITRPGDFEESYARALWIAGHAPPETVFAAPDCGILGYFSGRSFVNTDGLTNSFDFQRAIAADTVAEWLTARGVNAVVSPRENPPRKLSDGTYRQEIPVRRGTSGDQRFVHAVVVPWEPGPRSGPYALWRIVRVARGSVPGE